MARPKKHADDAAKMKAYRNAKKLDKALRNGLEGQLILELFPGAGLLGKAFESLGACVVRGPDILWGGDVREFKGIANRFDGIIGGPPCQVFSKAAITGSSSVNLIPEFVRIVDECKPSWAVMENVREARHAAPQWPYTFIRDWDCGGLTHRARGFWFYGLPAAPKPPTRQGNPHYSVLASNWNRRGQSSFNKGYVFMTPKMAADLQGFPALAKRITNNQPGWKRADGTWNGVSKKARHVLAVHMLGNGVPFAMGSYIAKWIACHVAGIENLFSPSLIPSSMEEIAFLPPVEERLIS